MKKRPDFLWQLLHYDITLAWYWSVAGSLPLHMQGDGIRGDSIAFFSDYNISMQHQMEICIMQALAENRTRVLYQSSPMPLDHSSPITISGPPGTPPLPPLSPSQSNNLSPQSSPDFRCEHFPPSNLFSFLEFRILSLKIE